VEAREKEKWSTMLGIGGRKRSIFSESDKFRLHGDLGGIPSDLNHSSGVIDANTLAWAVWIW